MSFLHACKNLQFTATAFAPDATWNTYNGNILIFGFFFEAINLSFVYSVGQRIKGRIEAVLLLPQIDTVFYDTMNTINMLLWFRAIYFLFLSGYKKKGYRRICSFATPDQFIFFVYCIFLSEFQLHIFICGICNNFSLIILLIH